MSTFTFKKDGVDVSALTLTSDDFSPEVNQLRYWYSDEKGVTNFNTVTTNVVFGELTPDGANTSVDFRLQAIIQGKEDDGSWVDLVSQGNPYSRTDQAAARRLIVTEGVSDFEPAVEFFQADALQRESLGVTHEQAPVPDEVRLCIVLGDINSTPANAALTSVKVTATGTLK